MLRPHIALGSTIAAALVLLIGCAAASEGQLLQKLLQRAESGSAAAQYNVGMFYNNGIGTARDPKLAFQWFEKAAAGGDPLGSYKVGCYYAGQFRGTVQVDEEKALAFKLVAAKAGYSRAQHDVALIYVSRGDWQQAVPWLQSAAAQSDVEALVLLADAYAQGKGVGVDNARSYEMLVTAARLVSKEQLEAVRSELELRRQAIGEAAAAEAERNAASWAPHPTPLTARASQGIEEARRIAQ